MDKKYKVLIVEDEESLRLIYSQYLTQENFEVVAAPDGEKAIEILKETTDFDIVLLDVMLPKVDGIGVLTYIKEHPKTKHLKVYMMTVLSTEAVIQKAYDLGAEGYLVKDTMTPEDIKNEIIVAIEGNGQKKSNA